MSGKEYHNVNHPETYDATEPNDSNYFSTLPFMNVTQLRKRTGGTRRARLHFAGFCQLLPRGQDFLCCSTNDFKERFDVFGRALRAYMFLLAS